MSSEVAQDDTFDVFECHLIDTCTGNRCGMIFHSERALQMHQSFTKGHNMTKSVRPHALVVTNMCPWCMKVYSGVKGARAHASRSFINGQCGNRGSVNSKFQPLKLYKCVLCDLSYGNFTDYAKHCRLHGLPQTGLTRLLHDDDIRDSVRPSSGIAGHFISQQVSQRKKRRIGETQVRGGYGQCDGLDVTNNTNVSVAIGSDHTTMKDEPVV